jgi:hypothetical protein
MGRVSIDGKFSQMWADFPCVGSLPIYGKYTAQWSLFFFSEHVYGMDAVGCMRCEAVNHGGPV